MMVMDNYYNNQHQFPPEMLWREITSMHLIYLEMPESPEKIEHKNKLEKFVHNYLCVAHHNQKFECGSTARVLHKSAATMSDFSGYKAALGFDAIGRYAANLITKPWRPEYREIKMYSGFFKHEVESNLVGAEDMFIDMGYHQVDTQLLELKGPICPDQLTSVSLDSIMAYVECQILKEIWEKVQSVYCVTWLEVLGLRESYAGSPQETIEALIYMKKMPPQVVPQTHKLVHPYYQSQPQPQPPSQYPPVYPNVPHNCCGNFYMHQPSYPPYSYGMQPCYSNQHQSHMHAHHPSSTHNHSTHVPTGQLIELEPMYDQPDGGVGQSTSIANDLQRKMTQMYIDPKPKSTSERDDGSGTYESWDYVYRNLESQGYSKDLGERGDLLQEGATSKAKSKEKPPPHVAEETKRERRESKYSTYDNVSDKPVLKPSPAEPQKYAPKPTTTTTSNGDASMSTKKPQPSPPTATKRWQCKACTYLNTKDKDICEMCSKSRRNPLDEHLQVGGTQCENCTYVNNKGQKMCTICGSSLNNSPTYI